MKIVDGINVCIDYGRLFLYVCTGMLKLQLTNAVLME